MLFRSVLWQLCPELLKMMAACSHQQLKAEYGRLETAESQVSTVPAVSAIPMIQVDAPANLPEGYSFEAEISGQRVTVVVVSEIDPSLVL